MKVEITSTQCIKPSSPTPQHLKTHKLSLLDHFVPPMYIPIVFFYTADQSIQSITNCGVTQQRLKQLKQSLSEALTHFYPFAGRIKDKFSIDCNDEGVHYTQAKARCSLFEFLNQSNLSSFIHKLVPTEEADEGHVTKVQVTCFACGGIVVGTLVSHMIADGAAASFFLNSWGATSRGAFNTALFPNFDTPFPKHDAYHEDANLMSLCGQFLKRDSVAMRRFLFDAEAISKLKAKGCSLTVQNPTRVEAVSSFICKCVTSVFKVNSGLERPTFATHAVNMRRRAIPAFPESCMGNFIWTGTALIRANELPDLVIKFREAITAINSDFVKSFQGEGGFVRYSECLKEMVETATNASLTSGLNYVNFTSWRNFSLYDVDFGWGKPTWVSCTTASPDFDTVFFNSVLLMDTPSGNGIEAWIYLNEHDMNILQQDKELLAFATIDPNPLQSNSSACHA